MNAAYRRILHTTVAITFALSLQGCLVTSVAGAAVGVTGAVVGTTLNATGAVIGAGFDVVTTSDAEEMRKMQRGCERRVQRGSSEDCSVYRPN